MVLQKSDVSIVLNGYKRPHVLKRQLSALRNQTVEPNEILIWRNDPASRIVDLKFSLAGPLSAKVTKSDNNFGVWARFSYALMAKSEFVCVIDDDTIPGKLWLENCLASFRSRPGLYGTIGVRFNSSRGYDGHQTRLGWDNPNEKIERVDIVGHSWFFPKDYLGLFWREFPTVIPISAGEDIHFSYTLQKYGGIDTLVPPHPVDNQEMWGSNPALATKYGGDANATANHAIPLMNDYLQKCIDNGFKLMRD